MLATAARRWPGVKEAGSSNGRKERRLVELPTTTFAWRRVRCLADKMINSLHLLSYPAIGKNDGSIRP
jgi:hypothetical protein